jgi:hypothetical protein
MNYEKKLNSIIRKFDLESDVQRKQAYIECVKYADTHYANTFDINPFLKEAAEILKQEYIVKDAIYCMTPFDKTERVMLEYTKSNGPTMTANKSGLVYLSKLLLNLSKAKMTGEHVHLWGDKYPMVGKTFPLTIYIGDDSWFSKHDDSDEADQKPEPEMEQRDIDPFSIVGVVFTRPGPPTIQLEPLKFYKIRQTEKYTDQKVWKKKIRNSDNRLYVFTFLDDSNVSVRFALDLDDKEVFFLSQKDLGK